MRTLKNQIIFGLELTNRKSYKIIPSNYNRIQQNKITDTYKLDNRDTLSHINNDTAKFACKLHINDRIAELVKKKKNPYILSKNHKLNFHDKQHSRFLKKNLEDELVLIFFK